MCDDGFGQEEADAVCRMMGYEGGAASHSESSTLSSADFTMDDLNCPAGATDLSECSWTSSHNCGISEGVVLICSEFSGHHAQDSPFVFVFVFVHRYQG